MKVTLNRRSVNQFVLVPSPRGFIGAPSERIPIRHQDRYIKATFVYVTNGRAACEACSAKWNLGINLAFALGPRKTTENLDWVCRSQDLPDSTCPAYDISAQATQKTLFHEVFEVEVTWRLTVSQYDLLSNTLVRLGPDISSCRNVAVSK
jgi:hypothetical protein